jgi:hypothetical protein
MMKILSTYCIYPIGVLLLACFTLSLLWCTDVDCLTGTSDEECMALICSLLDKHNMPAEKSAAGNSKDCSCVCHAPTLSIRTFKFNYFPDTQRSIIVAAFTIPSTPSRPIYHPPRVI